MECNNNNNNKKIKTVDISVCVACHPPYIPRLSNLLNSIQNASRHPMECIIGLSETSTFTAFQLQNNLQKKYDFKITISSSEKKCYQAENRNRAIRLVKSKYVTVNDADDTVHYKRLEIIYDIMEKEKCLAFLHSFKKYPKADFKKLDLSQNNWDITNTRNLVYGDIISDLAEKTKNIPNHLYLPPKCNGGIDCHHAYITFDKIIFKNVQQQEDGLFYRREDSKFVRDILKYYGPSKQTMVYFDIKLVNYELPF